MKNKCKDCTKREINCHSHCQDYIDFRNELDECNEKYRKEYRESESPYYRDGWKIRRKRGKYERSKY